jgi:hypothetical protein
MEHGPVPSFVYDALKGTVSPEDKLAVDQALVRMDETRHPSYRAAREADLSFFSQTDIECLDRAIEHCRRRSFGAISDETHRHVAWDRAELNGPISVEDIMDGVDPDIIEDAKVFAAYGVL